MRTSLPAAGLACFVASCGLIFAPDASAATSHAWSINGGSSCQLSIPTTNTGVRPKATGFRNESTTTGNFVICPISSSVTPPGGNTFQYLLAFLQSMDGATHDVTCTATVGWNSLPPKYSSKTKSIGPSATFFEWSAADFGGTEGNVITASMISSVTCNLPPQVLIEQTEGAYDYNIGT